MTPGRVISSIDNAGNGDIIHTISHSLPYAARQMKDYSRQFAGASDTDTGRNIWLFLKSLSYVKDDENNQVVQLPSRLLKTRAGDCKSYSLFTAAILKNLGIPFVFRYTNYKGIPIPSHVYVVANPGTDRQVIIDGVYSAFNAEKPYKYKKDMKVSAIAGLPGAKPVKRRSQILNYPISGAGETAGGAAGSLVGNIIFPGLGGAAGNVVGQGAGRLVDKILGGIIPGPNKIKEDEGRSWSDTYNFVKSAIETAMYRVANQDEILNHVAWIRDEKVNPRRTRAQWVQQFIANQPEYLKIEGIRQYYKSLGVPDGQRLNDFIFAERNNTYSRDFLTQQAKAEFKNSGSAFQNLLGGSPASTGGKSSSAVITAGLGIAALLAFTMLKK